tara:strand:+ start:5456 stop:5647 length:192 start_codon:yes stop_codon:yes gene_type:complete
MTILGYILVAVTLSVHGEVVGTGINYHKTKQDCITDANREKALAPPGYGFVCLEDVVQFDKKG